MMDKSIMVDGLAVLWEEVLEFVGSKVWLDGNARHAIAHRSAQANKCMTKWRPVLSSSWLPRLLRLNIVKNYNVAGLSLEFECLDDGQDSERQNCELECEDGGERYWREKAAMDGIGRVVETQAQNWTSLDRKGQYERVDGHQRTHAQLGWSCCQDGPQRNLCGGLEMPRSSMVEMETTPLERSGERQMVWPTPTAVLQIYRWEYMVAGDVSKFTGNADGLSESVQENTGWLHLVQHRGSWTQFSKCGKSQAWMVPGCLGDPCASGMTGTNAGATWSAKERNVWWCRAGYGWLDSYGSGYGRRRGYGEIPEDVWFCVTCRMVPWRCGVEVLSWNVSGDVFVAQNSSVETGNDRLFHLGKLLPRPKKTKKGANEPMRARAMHIMVINIWMNPNTEQEFLHSPCNSVVSSSARIHLCECWTEAVGK